ncbi:MAG: DNA-directed RNA polymerase subunit beta' [Aeriscardovia sp.]|nr:DNA-directed RNA polymerase subunit beta' [Aeriscardovia sp.]
MIDVNEFSKLRISMATTEDIRGWSHGEIKKPETINYRTLKPEKEGLFSEQVFGPTRDWECACGKYKRVRYKGIVCERCGVEVTQSRVRRERMGHIDLAAPVTHIWYFKGIPSRLGYLLDIPTRDLDKVIYFASYIVTYVDEKKRKEELPKLERELEARHKGAREKALKKQIETREKKLEADLEEIENRHLQDSKKRKQTDALKQSCQAEIEEIKKRFNAKIEEEEKIFNLFKNLKQKQLIDDIDTWHLMCDAYGDYFKGGMGAEAIKQILETLDLKAMNEALREEAKNGSEQKKQRAFKRLKVVDAFLNTTNRPEAMVLEAIPVIPPDLRPMIQLDGGRFATSDLNDLYRRVINRNNRLKRLKELSAPEIMLNNEKRMLQEAVDSLFDNGRRGKVVTGASNRPLKSLAMMLKGKAGRFRQNLLGKRVDFSGRSVIVVGPELKMHQCGLPKPMALELFKPFVIRRLVELEYVQNIKGAKRLIDRTDPVVWDVLEEVIHEHPVLLNRAPTLHRLSIEAFEPILVEGKAIHLPPLACAPFNADFDGDQMAVHLPLSVEAQAESRVLMLASNSILKPADGHTVTMPSQDMILGLYWLTTTVDEQQKEIEEAKEKYYAQHPKGERRFPQIKDAKGQGKIFSSVEEARMALDRGEIGMQSKVLIRMDKDFVPPKGWKPGELKVPATGGVVKEQRLEDGGYLFATNYGRLLFNSCLPVDYPFINSQISKSLLSKIVDDIALRYDTSQASATLDALKDMGFTRAQWSGVTIAFSDIQVPPEKEAVIKSYEERTDKINEQYGLGFMTEEEKREEIINLWTQCTDQVAEDMEENFAPDNDLNIMVRSGARGNWMQIRQIAGMRGLVTNPKGEIIPRPVKSNYRDGLSSLEYFISQHGARKGLADTALRTAESGYLTRRLVDVSQEVIVREKDCGTKRGIEIPIASQNEEGEWKVDEFADASAYSRLLSEDVMDPESGEVLMNAQQALDMEAIENLVSHGVHSVKVRSVLTCESPLGVCASCYGWSLSTNTLVDIGEAVGVVAAQSIGEPGTQLTLRSFHSGGVASASDITQGLPRVTELFEARTPRGKSEIAPEDGTVEIDDSASFRLIKIIGAQGEKLAEFKANRRVPLLVHDGEFVKAGTQLAEGSVDPKEVLRICGAKDAEFCIVKGVHDVYRSQGVGIHDKHIEVIVHQMVDKVQVIDSGDTSFLPGDLINKSEFRATVRSAIEKGKKPAIARECILGITKAALATDSWLSAASFQETTRVLTEAALQTKEDNLNGLKENVIIGKLIPAGTGLSRYRNSEVDVDSAVKEHIYPTVDKEKDVSPFFASQDASQTDLSGFDFDNLGEDMGAGEILTPDDPGAYGEEDDSEPIDEPDSDPDDFPDGSQEDMDY